MVNGEWIIPGSLQIREDSHATIEDGMITLEAGISILNLDFSTEYEVQAIKLIVYDTDAGNKNVVLNEIIPSRPDINNDQFLKYSVSIVKTQDNETTVYESTDVTSLYLVGPLETATEYTASVQLVTKDFGKSDYTNPITIKTLPSKLSGKNSQNQYN